LQRNARSGMSGGGAAASPDAAAQAAQAAAGTGAPSAASGAAGAAFQQAMDPMAGLSQGQAAAPARGQHAVGGGAAAGDAGSENRRSVENPGRPAWRQRRPERLARQLDLHHAVQSPQRQPSKLDAFNNKSGKFVTLDAQKNDGLIKVLAEPTVMAISGQEASFLAGGKIFIPVSQSNTGGTPQITLEEKEYGVAVKFTPTVLDGGRINLRVSPEVSELNREGIGVSATGSTATAILPSFTTRRATTTVQLFDGQSFAIGGLIKNNVTSSIKAFPGLGEIPILGALFRSSDFQNDRTELVFIVTPHLAQPLPPDHKLPTDDYVQPSRVDFFLNGKMEGAGAPRPHQRPRTSGRAPRCSRPPPRRRHPATNRRRHANTHPARCLCCTACSTTPTLDREFGNSCGKCAPSRRCIPTPAARRARSTASMRRRRGGLPELPAIVHHQGRPGQRLHHRRRRQTLRISGTLENHRYLPRRTPAGRPDAPAARARRPMKSTTCRVAWRAPPPSPTSTCPTC
jgi:pilus assembly protein CpaC